MDISNSFTEISNKIDNMNYRLNNGPDLIKEYCINLRTKVMLATELVIQKIQDRSDELTRVIDQYQQSSIADFEAEDAKKLNTRELITELKLYHENCSQGCKTFDQQDKEIETVKIYLESLEERIRLGDNLLENLIFGRKLVFYPNIEIKGNLIGEIKLRKIEYADSIDLDKLKKLSLNDIFELPMDPTIEEPNFKHLIKVNSYEDGKIAVAHVNKSRKLTISIIDQFGSIYKSLELESYCSKILDFKAYKGFIVLHFKGVGPNVYVIDPTFQKIQFINIKLQISIDINDKIICFLDEDSEIMFWDHEFAYLNSIQLEDGNFPDYTGDKYFQIKYQFNKFYCLNHKGIDIYDENTKAILKSIKKSFVSFTFDWQGNILAFNGLINVYNSNGSFINDILAENFRKFLNFHIDKNGQFIFLDTEELMLYLE